MLGQLPPNARHEFELQLTQSAELRAIVQELEEGVEAVARAVPQRPPPPQTWNPIEQAIAREVERKMVRPSFWSTWWRSGWAAAAACLVAFLGYAWWPKPKTSFLAKPIPIETTSAVQTPPAESYSVKPIAIRPEQELPTNVMTVMDLKPAVPLVNPELASLRWQIASLQTQLEQLSDVVSQQRAILAEPGRFKFFPLTASNSEAGSEPPAPLSPGLQRAMFYAMARDMGWLPGLNSSGTQNGSATTATIRTFAGVDFVDMNSAASASATTVASATTSSAAATTAAPTETAPTTVVSAGGIPGVLTKQDLILALDKTLVPRGAAVTFWRAADSIDHELIGSTVINDNPTVVKIPIDQIGKGMSVSFSAFSGPSNIGHFYILRAPGTSP